MSRTFSDHVFSSNDAITHFSPTVAVTYTPPSRVHWDRGISLEGSPLSNVTGSDTEDISNFFVNFTRCANSTPPWEERTNPS
jgi:hypothetical protein